MLGALVFLSSPLELKGRTPQSSARMYLVDQLLSHLSAIFTLPTLTTTTLQLQGQDLFLYETRIG